MRQSGLVMLVCVAVCGGSVIACGGKEGQEKTVVKQPAVHGTMTTIATPDSDKSVNGGATANGAPKGFVIQLDKAEGAETPAYTGGSGGRWDVRTGPAHILYTLNDTARKKYSVSATFEQLEAPEHPEAFGVFIGGADLETPAKQRYTYFLIRGDGKYAVKRRNGTATQTVTEWTQHPAIPPQSATGTGVYGIHIDVDDGIAKVRVNGQPVTMFSGGRSSLDGIAGARVNHNLHVMVTPVQITSRR